MKRNLLITVATIGLLSTTYGAGDSTPLGCAATAAGAASASDVVTFSTNKAIHDLLSNPAHKYDVIETLAVMPLDEQGSLMDVLRPLVPVLNSIERLEIIKAFASIPKETRADVAGRAKILFWQQMNLLERAHIIKALGSTLSDVACADTAKPSVLCGGRMNADLETSVLKVLAEMPAAELDTFLAQVNRLNMETSPYHYKSKEGEYRWSIIQALANVPAAQRDTVAEKATRLFGESIDINYRVEVIHTLGTMTTDEQDTFVGMISPIIAGINEPCRYEVMNSIINVPAGDRAIVAAKVKPFCVEKVDGFVRSQLINALKEIPVDEHDTFAAAIVRLKLKIGFWADIGAVIQHLNKVQAASRTDVASKASILCNKSMSNRECAEVIDFFASLSSVEAREDFINIVSPLIAETDREPFFMFWKIIFRVDAAELRDFIRITLPFIKEIKGLQRFNFLEKLLKISAAERESVIKNLSDLMGCVDRSTPSQESIELYRLTVIDILLKLPFCERDEFTKIMHPLIAEIKGSKLPLFRSLQALKASERADIVAHATGVFAPGEYGYSLPGIIDKLAMMAADKRAPFMDLVARFPNYYHYQVFYGLIMIPEDERDEFAEQFAPIMTAIFAASDSVSDSASDASSHSERCRYDYFFDEPMVITALAGLPLEERRVMASISSSLVTHITHRKASIPEILEALTKVPAAQRPSIAANIPILLSLPVYLPDIIPFLANFPESERYDLVAKTLEVAAGDRDITLFNRIIEALTYVSPTRREEFFTRVSSMIASSRKTWAYYNIYAAIMELGLAMRR